MGGQQGQSRSWDDYFIPGTSVLRNRFTGPGRPYGETDQAALTTLEEQYARSRLLELHEALMMEVAAAGYDPS